MEEKLQKKAKEAIERILKDGIATTNLDHLYKLTKINHMLKEEENMNNNYGNYNGRGPTHGSYGNYNEYRAYDNYNDGYGRRGYDAKYRGHEYMDRMYNEYGRYMEDKQHYGANEDTKRSLQYMLKSMEDFARMLKEEAQSQEEVQMIRETAQRIASM